MITSCRISDRDDWFDVWIEERCSMQETMLRNMHADIDAGWSFWGECVQKQMNDLDKLVEDYEKTMDMFKTMEDKDVNRWCFYDLKKRGAIA